MDTWRCGRQLPQQFGKLESTTQPPGGVVDNSYFSKLLTVWILQEYGKPVYYTAIEASVADNSHNSLGS